MPPPELLANVNRTLADIIAVSVVDRAIAGAVVVIGPLRSDDGAGDEAGDAERGDRAPDASAKAMTAMPSPAHALMPPAVVKGRGESGGSGAAENQANSQRCEGAGDRLFQ